MSTFAIRMLGPLAIGAAAVVTLVAGCGSSSSSGQAAAGAVASTAQTASSASVPASSPLSTPTASGSASALKTRSTSIGTVLVAPSGRTVYELVGDSAAKPACTGGCLAIWPAVKANGTQVIVNGHPAFTFVGDRSAGQTKGQDVTDQWGRWLALDASGNPISAPASHSTAPASHSAPAKSKAPNGGGAAF